MTSTNSPCGTTSPCASPVAERPRYYPRQIITPDDLMLEQEYFEQAAAPQPADPRRGVVCGAKVCPTPQTGSSGNATGSFEPWTVSVTPGYILAVRRRNPYRLLPRGGPAHQRVTGMTGDKQ